jgi:fluoride exporter
MSPSLMPQALAVALGAAIGALARWRVGLALASSSAVFPLGTLVVNAVGGFAIGVAMVFVERGSLWQVFLVTGMLGGFTTFSAFSAESLGLIQRGQWFAATVHALAHVLGALACTWMGYAIAKVLHRG